MPSIKRYIATLLSISTLVLGLQSSLVQAEMITTDTVLESHTQHASRQDLVNLLQQDEVQQKMAAFGITAEAANERIGQLSNQELAQLNAHIEELPAGSGVVGVAVIVLLTLVFLDIFGVTDIFSFIKPIK